MNADLRTVISASRLLKLPSKLTAVLDVCEIHGQERAKRPRGYKTVCPNMRTVASLLKSYVPLQPELCQEKAENRLLSHRFSAFSLLPIPFSGWIFFLCGY